MGAEWQPPEGRARLVLQGLLLLAGLGALAILVGLFGTLVEVAGLVAIVAGTVLTAPRAPMGDWWAVLAAGALLSIAAAIVGLGSDTVGGLLAVLGGVLVLVGVTLGFPLRRS